MLIQYTAASIVSECKSLAHPASVDSIPSSAGQEDHVSMGMTAARHLREIVTNTELVLAMESIAAAQALDLRAPLRPGAATRAALELIRGRVAFLSEARAYGRGARVEVGRDRDRGSCIPQGRRRGRVGTQEVGGGGKEPGDRPRGPAERRYALGAHVVQVVGAPRPEADGCLRGAARSELI